MLTRETFNEEIASICSKSERLCDTFRLVEAQIENFPVVYLEYSHQSFTNGDIYNLQCHVVYSDSYQCPVLYLNVNKSNGALLSYMEIYELFKLDLNSGSDMVLTQQDHPYLNRPFFYLHPCKTALWMKESEIEGNNRRKVNVTLKWLSFTFSTLRIPFKLEYGLD